MVSSVDDSRCCLATPAIDRSSPLVLSRAAARIAALVRWLAAVRALALVAKAKDPAVKRFKPSTAGKVWEAVTALFGVAAESNVEALRVLKMDPASAVKLGL
jgi:hypothetical protein